MARRPLLTDEEPQGLPERGWRRDGQQETSGKGGEETSAHHGAPRSKREMVIRLRGFPPPVWVQSACRHRRRGLIVAPQSRLERGDSCCRSAKAPKELECSALEAPAICDEACANAPRLTLRHIGPLLLSPVVQGGAQPHLTIRILGNGVNVVQSSDCPDIDERVQRAIIAVSRASTPAPMDSLLCSPSS